MKINRDLVKSRNLTEETVKEIQKVYSEISSLIQQSHKMDANRFLIGKQIEELEFKLQRLWGFPEDASFHTHYMKLFGCTCPSMDNRDSLGFKRYINGDCEYHSNMS